MYLSGSTRQFFKRPDLFGCMFNTAKNCGETPYGKQAKLALKSGCKFMIDNGVFVDKWTHSQWSIELYEYLEYRHNCLGVIVPDFLYYLDNRTVRGDWKKTLKRFYQYQPFVKWLGFKVAFATQDGMPLDLIPWHKFDTLFVGGSDAHKRGLEAETLALEAKKRDKWVHVGRVSSISKAEILWGWADSWDGTTFRFAPDEKEEKMIPQLEKLLNQKKRYWQRKML